MSVRSISFLTSPQRLQVARADTLLPRNKRAFFLQRVAFHLRPHGAVAPSDADVEAAIAAAQRALTQHGELLADNPRAHMKCSASFSGGSPRFKRSSARRTRRTGFVNPSSGRRGFTFLQYSAGQRIFSAGRIDDHPYSSET